MSAPRQSCADCRTLVGGYLLGALEPDEMDAVRAHLDVCPECAAEHERLADIPGLLTLAGPDDAPAERPPAQLEEAVLDRFAREQPEPAESAAARPPRRGRRFATLLEPLRRPLPAAALGALAATAVALAVALPGGGPASGPAAGESYQASLSGSPAAPAARATARLETMSSGTTVRLRVRGLRGGPGDLYELWCVRDDGSKISAGTFRADARGEADATLTTAAVIGEYHRLSVERRRQTVAAAPGQRVMTGEIRFGDS